MLSGDPTKMAMVNIKSRLPPGLKLAQMSQNLTALLPCLSVRINCIYVCLTLYSHSWRYLFLCLTSFVLLFIMCAQRLSLSFTVDFSINLLDPV